MRSAAAITSITMNGGTSLRADGASSLASVSRLWSVVVASSIGICYLQVLADQGLHEPRRYAAPFDGMLGHIPQMNRGQ